MIAETVLLHEMTGSKVRELLDSGRLDKVFAVFGSTENHGPHLPYGNDTFIPLEIAKRAARELGDAIVLPPMYFGFTPQHMAFPLTITLSAESLLGVVRDVFRSVAVHSIRKIIVVNEHDGNVALIQAAARELRREFPDLKIALFEGWWVPEQKATREEIFQEASGWGHAGEGETSLALALHPHLVDLKVAKGTNSVPDLPPHVWWNWEIDEFTTTGALGYPQYATREKGTKILDICVKQIVDTIRELDKRSWKVK